MGKIKYAITLKPDGRCMHPFKKGYNDETMTMLYTEDHFLGLECVGLSNGTLELLVTQKVGPRILSLRLPGRENLLAELPDFVLAGPGGQPLHLWGGHRLWYAPEVREITYLPDNAPVEITPIARGMRVVQPAEVGTGMQKSLTITMPNERAMVVVEHTLTNGGSRPRLCAPWAITQLKSGGFAILPQKNTPTDVAGLQPNRALVLWPYTDINNPFIHWGNQYVFVQAEPARTEARGVEPASEWHLKIGWPNPSGWMAYQWQDMLFIKEAVYQPETIYFDMGSSSQCYCRPGFIELETLGPRTLLEPGQTVHHKEVWHVLSPINLGMNESDAAAFATGWKNLAWFSSALQIDRTIW